MKKIADTSLLKTIAGLIFWLSLCYLTAWFGAQFSPGIASSEWYESLNKPVWNPPSWVFGPVWTLLYTFMGIAVWLVWKKFGFKRAGKELGLFITQLVLNGAWSFIFFGLQSPGWALIEIFLLLNMIVITTWFFREKNKLAAWLMVPYILWVGFAMMLNAAIWWMN